MSLRYGEAPGGPDDRQRVSRARFSSALPFDPTAAHTVHVRLTNTGPSRGTVMVASLAPGALWQRSDPERKRWWYVGRSTPLQTAVKGALLKERPGGSGAYEFAMSARDGGPEHVPLSVPPDTVRVTLEIESAGAGVCVERTLAGCRSTPMVDTCAP